MRFFVRGLFLAALVAAPTASATRPAQAPSLRWVQEVLARHQYYIDPVDGRPGPRTRSALYQFQMDRIDRGLVPTGKLDAKTLEQLGELDRR